MEDICLTVAGARPPSQVVPPTPLGVEPSSVDIDQLPQSPANPTATDPAWGNW